MLTSIFKFFLWCLVVVLSGCIALGIIFYTADQPPSIVYATYALPQSKQIMIGGVMVHYCIEGNEADSTPLLLIHGTSSSLRTWDGVTAQLKKDYRIIRFDLPGFGLTGPQPEKNYSKDYYNAVIDTLLEKLSLSKVIVVGNSLGGSVAANYALYRPEKVRGLVLVDAAGVPPLKKTKGAIGFKLAQMPGINKLLTRITPKFLVKKSLEDAYGNPEKVTDSLTTQYFDMLTREGNRGALVDRMRMGWQHTSSDYLIAIKTPTLILWGRKDNLIPVENADVFRKQIANSQLHIWDELGHVPMEEDPVQFSGEVKKWRDSIFLR